MAFTLKKILSAFLMPLSIGLFLFILGMWYLYTNSYKKAKFYLTISFLWIFLIAYGPVSNALLKPLESQYSKINLQEQSAKYILLLGGDFQARAYEAIKLHHKIHDSVIITSGYPGLGRKVPEAVENANKLMELGIKNESILMQSEPRDTIEEARNIRSIVGENNFILVTSAYHMPRAMSVFQKEGLNPIPAPTNFMTNSEVSFLSLPHGINVRKTEIAWHEYLGMLWNELKSFL